MNGATGVRRGDQVAAGIGAVSLARFRIDADPLPFDAQFVARRRNPVEAEIEIQPLGAEGAEQVVVLPQQPVVEVLRQQVEPQRQLFGRVPGGQELQPRRVILDALLEQVAAEGELPVAVARRGRCRCTRRRASSSCTGPLPREIRSSTPLVT